MIIFSVPTQGKEDPSDYVRIVEYVLDDDSPNFGQQTIVNPPPPLLHGISTEGWNAAGELAQHRVIGIEDRSRITTTQVYPWTTVVHISYKRSGQDLICTGWMLGKSTVATAAHCVYDGGMYGSDYQLTPGRDGGITPFSSCKGIFAHVPELWITTRNFDYDWAAIDIDCRIGTTTGVLGFAATSGNINTRIVAVTGYPSLHHPNGIDVGTSMWTHSGPIEESLPFVFRYSIDTSGGQSGGPTWELQPSGQGCSTPCVLGIYSAEYDPPILNQSVRITQEVFDNLYEWRQYVYPSRVYLPLIRR